MKKAEETKTELYIPRGGANEETTLLISVNGKNYALPKGKTSLVPLCVAREYRRSLEAQEAYDAVVRKLLSVNTMNA